MMADTTDDRTLQVENGRWIFIQFCLTLLKYVVCNVLRIVFYSAASVTSMCSSLFYSLSEKLGTSEISEDLLKHIVKRRNDFSSDLWERLGKPKQTIKVNSDLASESLQAKCGNYCSGDDNNVDGEYEETQVIADAASESVQVKNKNEEYEDTNKVIADTASESVQVKNKSEEYEDANYVIADITSESSVLVRNENEEYEETNKVIADVTSESVLVKNENVEYEETNTVIADIASESVPVTYIDCSYDYKNINEKYEDTSNMIADTSNEPFRVLPDSQYCDNTVSKKSEPHVLEETVDKNSEYSEGIEENIQYNFNSEMSEQKPQIQEAEDKSVDTKLNSIEVNLSKVGRKQILSCAAINLIHKSLKDTDENHRLNMQPKLNLKKFNLIELVTDICNLPSEYSIVHCINDYLQLLMTSDYKFSYDIGDLMDQHLQLGSCGEMVQNKKHVFFVVLKRHYVRKDFLKRDLEQAFNNLLGKMKTYNLTKLALQKSEFDSLNWWEVKETISKVFAGTKIEISVCSISSKVNLVRHILPKLYPTTKQLWEMEPQTDLIIFINMEEMYLENWKDDVVDQIDAKYPFKERLLKDITIKPLEPGDTLSYEVDKGELFCIFILPVDKNPFFFKCIEKAFKKMKLQMPGYRYLGIQKDYVYSEDCNIIPRCLLLLRTIFDNQSGEIWLCGNTDCSRQNQYVHYNNTIRTATELNKRVPPNINSKRLKYEKKNSIGKIRTNDVIEKNQKEKLQDDNTKTHIVKENVNTHSFQEENWDGLNV